ncbi:hypothetical protein chiPu_0008077 [Chiloscyllium punctatum]|uniref:Uncharacterized protein n=1 Tax=Chiloscyllium punctatum TaxID=137246 RepID=A0A401SGY0_CHIPU|nr:hypothetical protein [Chiloscyllium punctatum]
MLDCFKPILKFRHLPPSSRNYHVLQCAGQGEYKISHPKAAGYKRTVCLVDCLRGWRESATERFLRHVFSLDVVF